MKDIYEVFVKLNEASTNCIILLILSVPGVTRKCLVRDSGTRGNKTEVTVQGNFNLIMLLLTFSYFLFTFWDSYYVASVC